MNVFDNALLQSGGGREKLAQAATANQDVKGGLGAASQAVQNQIGRADDPSTPDVDESTGAIGQTNKAQSDAYKQVQDSLNAWKSGFQPKVANAQQNLVDLQNRVTGDLSDDPYNLNDETMGLFGLNRGQRLFNNNLSNYLTQASPTDINAANVATPEDYARYAALADLSGDQSNVLNQADVSKAGTAPTLNFDQNKLNQDIANSQQQYNIDYNVGGAASSAAQFAPSTYNPDMAYMNSMYSDIVSSSPQTIETYWIPKLESLGGSGYSVLADGVKKTLDLWKSNQGYNNTVNGPAAFPRLIKR